MIITGTLIVQMIVFLILVGFTMKFVWPPITAALDERAKKIAVPIGCDSLCLFPVPSTGQGHWARDKTRHAASLAGLRM